MLPSVLRVVTAFAFFSGCTAADSSYYRGAVVDYNVVSTSASPRDNLMANVRNYETFIKKAAETKADIIVFPEGGLLGSDATIFLNVPDPADKVTPAGNASWDEALRNLSSFANNSKIYVVVNLHESYTDPDSKEVLKYNTNVVFNRNGTVISRYRKTHLFGSEALNTTKDPEYSVFDTDFGVKFGQFICFDILFEEPALKLVKEQNIKNFVYPTWWFSELPFLTAPQAQWSWAVGNNVNLLASGVNHLARGSTGSSIIRGRFGYWGDSNYVFSNNTGSTLIVANIPKDPSTTDSTFTESLTKTTILTGPNATVGLLTQPGLANATLATIALPTNATSARFNRQLCHDDFCCRFDLNITYENTLVDTIHYTAAAYSGNRLFGKTVHGVQFCGVYAYGATPVNDLSQFVFGPVVRNVTFARVKISGNFRTSNSEILPDVLLHPGATLTFLPPPSDVSFTTGDTSELVWNPNKQIISVGIHSRTFHKNAASSAQTSAVALLLTVLVAGLMTKYY